jgi:hypothetical protein
MNAIVQTGDAYILKSLPRGLGAHGGFQWPREGHVVAPDWREDAECGGGLHSFLWGEGDGNLACWDDDAEWIVARVTRWIDCGGKVKSPEAWVEFVGDRKAATDWIVAKGARGAVVGGTATAGDRGTATAGDYGTATAGDYGTATAGDYGTATAGDGGTATAGYGGTATAGDYGTLVIRWHDRNRARLAVGYVGENGIKPNTPYRVANGNLTEAM